MLPESCRPLSARQVIFLEHMWSVIEEFYGIPPAPFGLAETVRDLSSRRVSYGGEVVSVRRRILCDKVVPVWPPIGQAAEDTMPERSVDEVHLGAWLAIARDPRWDQLPDGVRGVVEACLSDMLGDRQFEALIRISWMG